MSAPSAINNAMQLIIGGSANITTTSLNSATFRANTGEVGIFDKHGARLLVAGAAANEGFVIAVSRGANLPPIQTDVMYKLGSSASARLFLAATEQSVAVGYNGTSGSIADIVTYAGQLYSDRIIFSMFMSGSDDERIKRGDYQSNLNSTQADVALGIVGSLVRNFDREVSNAAGQKPVVFSAICNVAATGNEVDGDVTLTRGSKVIAIAAAATYNTGTPFVIGDFIRLQGVAAGAVALTSPIYKIVGINGLNLTLDRPVDFASVVLDVSQAGVQAQGITAAAGAAADWGYVKTCTVLDYRVGKSKYKKVRFQSQLSEAFGSTPVTVLANANEGIGTITKIQELENFLNGYSGEQYRMGEPYLFNSTDNVLADPAVAGGGYDILSVSHQHVLTGFTQTVSKKELLIAVPSTSPTYVTGTDNITDVLEALVGTASGALAL